MLTRLTVKMQRFILLTALCLVWLISAFNAPARAASIDQLKVPQGFKLSIFAKVENPRQLAVGDDGTVFVGSRRAGNVYALLDSNKDFVADRGILLASGLNMPSGIAYKDGDLYVAEVHRVSKFTDVVAQLASPKLSLVFDQLPKSRHHGWKFIRFADNGDLIIPVGAPCNVCAPDLPFAAIFSLNIAQQKLTPLAVGVRNSVGFDFHPESKDLWFTDNGRDHMGDDLPPDEINVINKSGAHFGYPYFHGGDTPDPEFSSNKHAEDYQAPALNLGAHVAALGVEFYTSKQFPEKYHQQLFVAEHGSWNRSKKSGYRVMLATIEDNQVVDYQPFISGFMENEEVFGRPVAFAQLGDGSLLIADDFANLIYRVSYEP